MDSHWFQVGSNRVSYRETYRKHWFPFDFSTHGARPTAYTWNLVARQREKIFRAFSKVLVARQREKNFLGVF